MGPRSTGHLLERCSTVLETEARAEPLLSSLRSPVLYLLPTQSRIQQEVLIQSTSRLQPLSAMTARGASLVAPSMLSFPTLVERLYREVDEPRTVLSPLARTLIADEVIASYLGVPGRYFEDQKSFRGFTLAFLSWMDGLRRALVTPDAYERTILKDLPLGSDTRQVAELADLYRRYLDRMDARKLVDGPGMERDVLALLESPRRLAFLEGVRELRMDDFYDLTYVQFRTVLALTNRLKKARVVFPYNPERPDAYRFVGEHTIKYFELLGEERVASAIDPCFKFEELRPGTSLSFVLQHIFKPAITRQQLDKHAADGTLTVLAAPGLTREVESIGREIRRLMQDGVPAEAIGVVFRNLGAYGKLLEDVFTRYRIPFSFRRGSPLLSNPVISLALTVLELAMGLGDLERDRVVQFVASAYVTLPGADAAAFDQKTMAADIRNGSLAVWKEALARLKVGEDATLLALEAFLTPLTAPRPLMEFTHALRQALLVTLKVRQNIQQTKEAAVLARDLEALEQLESVLQDIDEAARALDLSRPFSLEAFHRLLLRGLEAGSLPGHGAHRGGVRILNALDARGLAFDYLFIGGLAEGQWPSGAPSSPLFSDAEKALFRDGSGRRLFRSSRMAAWEDPLLFCLTLAMARKRAILSYPTADGRGQATLKSYFLEEVLELVSITPVETPLDQLVTPLEQAADPWELAVGMLVLHQEGPAPVVDEAAYGTRYPLLPGANARPLLPPLTHLWRAATVEKQRDRFFRTGDAEQRGALAFPHVGRLGTAWQPLYQNAVDTWSATDLELFANCPTAWFMKKGLGLKEIVLPEIEAPASTVGKVVHEILQEYFSFQKRSGRWLFGNEEQAIAQLMTTCEEVFRRYESGTEPLGDRFFWELRKHEIILGLRRVVERLCEDWDVEQRWTPSWFELSFGLGKGPFPQAVPIDVPEVGTIRVRGQIDRIDVGDAGHAFRIVDYKWSKSADKLQEITRPDKVGDTKFQLLVYLHVMARLLPEMSGRVQPGCTAHGGIHLLRKAELRHRPFESLDVGPVLSPLLKRAHGGQFDTTPRDCPLTCAYRYVCRYYVPQQEPEA